jgi:hypothetical protein
LEGEIMIGKTRALHLGGASALAIGAAAIFIPVKANGACVATRNIVGETTVSVNVVCALGDPVVAPFATSYNDIYLGNGADRLDMSGGNIQAVGGALTPAVAGTDFRLDPSIGIIEMLGGDDFVNISGGTIGDATTTIGLSLGDGADTFVMSGGTITGSVFGLGGGNTYAVSGGLIQGSLFAGSENDTVTISGTANIQVDTSIGPDSVGLEDGNDMFTMTGGTLGGSVSGNAGNDVLTIRGGTIGFFVAGNEGDDQIFISGGPIAGNVSGNEGDDRIIVSGGTIGDATSPIDVDLGAGADSFEMSDGTIVGNVSGESEEDDPGADTFLISGGTITGSVFGLGGGNTYTISGGAIQGSLFAGSENDNVTVEGNANIGIASEGPDSVGLEEGNDIFNMTGGTLAGSVSGNAGNDRLTISGGTIGNYVAGNEGNDQIFISGGSIADDVRGNEGEDQITVSGGTIAGNVEAETVTLYGGTIGGNIEGITGNTLIINDSLVPDPLNLRDGVIFSGTNAVGTITDTDLAAGGTKTQFFTGFDTVTASNSTLGFGSGMQGIGQLTLGNGSTLFINGNVNMPGLLTVNNSTIDMIDGAADDVFTLGGLALNNGTIGVDLNQQTVQADQIVPGTFSATGTNNILVNLLGTPQFAGPTDIPIIVTSSPVAGTFVIQGIPGTPGSLFTYELIAGANGLFIRASPANFGIAAAPNSAINASTVDTAIDALYGINDDAIDADLGLANGAQRVQISPTFGVFASGQFAHVEHDGFTITNNNLSGAGPSFDANDFSAAISLDFNAAKHFGFDDQYGLNLGLFAGYASTDVGLDAFQGFDAIGDADNRSGMFGGYALFRQGVNYGLVSASAFIGETDVANGVLNTTGGYDTEGYAVTGSVGHIFMLTDRVRFDLRGGLLGVTFTGDDYTDSGGNQFGKSRISFGSFKFEPGIYADYQLDNGMVFSPYARADLQQRFGYRNTSNIDNVEIDFDDADFSVALSSGFNLRMSERATVSSEVRGKLSADSSTIGGKLGLKIAF